MEAEIKLEYSNVKLAEAVANAVSPDNYKTPQGLSIRTERRGTKVVTHIDCQGKLSTFIATVDDLLFCVSTAEKTVDAAKRLERHTSNQVRNSNATAHSKIK